MRVLYLNHTSSVSGAERSLLELAARMRERADVFLAAPRGDLLERASDLGIAVRVIDAPAVGFGSGPTVLARAGFGFVRTGARIRKIAAELRTDVLHAGSSRAGLILAGCGPGSPPSVVDVRDVLPGGARSRLVRYLLRWSTDALVFNSEYTRAKFGPVTPARGTVAYPTVDVGELLGLPLRAERGGASAPPTLGVIGQITPWKGQDDAIRILALVRASISNVRLRIAGSVVFSGCETTLNNDAYARSLIELASGLSVADAVEFTPSTEDMTPVFASLDAVLVPSWEEPFGRVVAEAMAAGVPVIATARGGPAEQIEDGVTGFLIEPRRPDLWSKTVCQLLTDAELRAHITRRARERVASTFAHCPSVELVAELYEELTGLGRGSRLRTLAVRP